MSTLLNTLRLCFLFSILQLTVTTVAGENVPPVVRLAEVLLHPRTNLNRNLHNRDVQTCVDNNQCSAANFELIAPCGTPEQIDAKYFTCLCDTTKKNPNFWSEFEQCENCLGDSKVDFSVEGPKMCESLQGPPSTPTTTEDVTVTETTTEDVTVTETPTEDVTVTGTVEETTITETTEETTTPETAGNQTTTTETTKKNPTTELTVVDKTTTTSQTVDQTPEATVSRGNSSTTRTGTPTPSRETETPESTDTGSGAIGSITTAQHGFQTAVWAFGIKLVVVAAFNFIL